VVARRVSQIGPLIFYFEDHILDLYFKGAVRNELEGILYIKSFCCRTPKISATIARPSSRAAGKDHSSPSHTHRLDRAVVSSFRTPFSAMLPT
jgi:hypothetical protein